MVPNTLPFVAGALALLVLATSGQSPPDARQAHGGLTGEIKPVLYVSDVERSAPFYRDTLGFRLLGHAGPEDDPYYADLAAATVKFGLHEPTAERQRAMVGQQRLYFRVRDLATHRSRVLAWGGEAGPVRETGWMDMFIVPDPDGNEIVFAVTDPQRHAIDPWHAQPAEASSIRRIDIDFPHGETRLQVWRNGEAYLYYGSSIRHKVIRPGTFDLDSLHEQLEPRLHENVPREQWPDPRARAGMVSIGYEGRSDRDADFLIFDGPFAEALFERARANIVGEGPRLPAPREEDGGGA